MRCTLALLLAAGLCAQTHPAGHSPAKASATAKSGATAFDKATFEAYVRHLFVWAPPIEVTVSDPLPSELPGFSLVTIHAQSGGAHQDEKFYVSKDGQKIVRGMVLDIARNPFQSDISKLIVDDQPQFGTKGAPVVLVEFSDFQCSYCREQAKTLRTNLLQTYPKEVHLYFLDFPLESLHPWAHSAAQQGRCIYHQSEQAFWEFHDWIFEHQAEIKTIPDLQSRIHDWAESQHLDTPKLNACAASAQTEQEVQRTMKLGAELNVTSTPSLYVNGRQLVGAVNWPELRRVIDYEVGYQHVAKNAGEDCGCDAGLPKPGIK
jgi:protein-disulfide isomerase